ncbi:HK97 family phage prohead protease [Caloranaerobacter ferrireducens]|uniref:HK97 family phage prohead protease n=1 Tax=Caloranaerobacter ferrireducens TaxID=1323370 RepID=UPI000A57C336|nr:HK97 family phage prohead protease [Caloranaerobacter ferrireducens]
MEKKEIRSFIIDKLEIRKSDDNNSMTVAGYVTKFNTRSKLIWGEFYEKVAKGAFARSLEENIIKALWNHRSDFVLGSTKNGTLRLKEDDVGLYFELDLPNSTWGKDAYESIKRGDVDGVSFGFYVRKDKWEYIKEEDVYERTLLDVDLFEISPTPFPAYPESEVAKRSLEEFKKEIKNEKDLDLRKRKLSLELELI